MSVQNYHEYQHYIDIANYNYFNLINNGCYLTAEFYIKNIVRVLHDEKILYDNIINKELELISLLNL